MITANFPLPRKPSSEEPKEQQKFNDEVIQTLSDLVKELSQSLKALATPGMVKMYGAATAPTGWLLCNGAAISRTAYVDLFAIIGTTFGVGDGSTTFNLPDFRGVFPRGAGTTDRTGAKDKGGAGAFFTATLGTYQNDLFQGHYHNRYSEGVGEWTELNQNAGEGKAPQNLSQDSIMLTTVYEPVTDGTNGTPQTGAETRPANLGIAFIIKT